MVKLDLGKAEELEIKLPTAVGSSKKQEIPKKIKKKRKSKIIPEKHLLLLY